MAKKTRFDDLLGVASTDAKAVEADTDKVTSVDASEGAGEFWAQFDDEEPEATDRLNVEIRRSLHNRLKRRCAEKQVSKRAVIEALIEWALSD
ncbi:hypothetical protein Lepto7375DRAFT_0889 [Leptolyngbya sp. PCC 7375]|nr:hypothetical protein Lepto7375DRAFT_0889 [Leptolyngbya sp. PCC 7375]